MTSLSGTYVLRKGQTRLFEPMHKMIVVIDAISIAMMLVIARSIALGPTSTGAAKSLQFPLVHFPALAPIEALAREQPLDEITISFLPPEPFTPPPGWAEMATPKSAKWQRYALSAITPIFVDFYERHTLSGDPYSWPSVLNFARVIRNAISHHDGHINFENMNASEIRWHALAYSPRDNGKLVIGPDIGLADVIILMFEMSRELDQLARP